jgi:hypothetical protein
MTDRTSSTKNPVRREDVRDAVASDWEECIKRVGINEMMDALGLDRADTITNATRRKHAPELHNALNSLRADPAALFKTFRLFGGCFIPIEGRGGDDMETVIALLHAATEYLDRVKDGQRCHVDTAVLAKLFAPLVPHMLAVIEQANGQEAPALKVVNS